MSHLQRIFVCWLLTCSMPGLVLAASMPAGVTAEQLRMVEQLSPQEQSALAKQYGVAVPAQAPVGISSPQTVQQREVHAGGVIESDVRQDTPDARQMNQVVAESVNVDVPVEKTNGQQGADAMELRRAFSDFVSESSPLTVDTGNLRQFGYELFAGVPTTFAPATDVPVPLEYVLGPGDELSVQLFGQKNSQFTLVVDREGAAAFPDIGPLMLAGASFAEAKAEIAKQVGDKMIGVSASVSMGKLRSIRVFALGEVERPGSYVVNGLATLSHALFASGGVKKIGSLRNVQLKRSGMIVSTIDLYDFLLKGDTSKDVRLMPGDVVFVPPIGATASIAGEVVRPAIYELKGKVNIEALLDLSGGLLPKAYKDEALLERISESGNQAVKSFALVGAGLQTKVRNGDVVKIFSTLDFEENPVLLVGNVKRPGKYAWKKGLRLSDLIQKESDLLPETFMDYGVIEREAKGNREPEIIRFKITDIVSKAVQSDDLLLASRDKVFIFHRSHFRVAPKITVAGSVKSPGEYALKKNMSLLDIVLAAGGLLRDSAMSEAELYRTDADNKQVEVLRFDLAKIMAGDDDSGIKLKDLDRVVIHSVWENQQQYEVRITGEVNNPGQFTFVSNQMRLTDLVFAAGGVTEKAMLGKGEVTRFTIVDGEARESLHMDVDLQAALAGDTYANILLQPYDVLTVRRLSNWREAEHVEMSGEIKYQGSYPIEEGEKLVDVLKRAGGFTDKAYLKGAVFTRATIRQEQQKQMDEMASRMEVEIGQMQGAIATIKDAELRKHQEASLEAAKRVFGQMKETKALGRLVIHLQDIEKMQNNDFNLSLADGDELFVPQRPDQVLVLGQVYNATAMIYRQGDGAQDYVDAAGGVTRFADEDRMYVVRADGYVQRVSGWGSTPVYPGDAIVVPENLDQFNLLDSTLDWSRVLMQVGVGLASMKTIGIL